MGSPCYGTTVAPEPSYSEVVRKSKLVGIVKIVSIPEKLPESYTEEAPPWVTVTVNISLNGLAQSTELTLLWDSGIRLDQITSYSSFMPTVKPGEVKIDLPEVDDEYFVFLEEHEKNRFRDIYGWQRRKLVSSLDFKPNTNGYPAYVSKVLRPDPLTQIKKSPSSYNRQKYLYQTMPVEDERITIALKAFNIVEPGEYWVLASDTAVKFRYTTKKLNPHWPAKHTVVKGDTLSSIANKYYDWVGERMNIFLANKSVIDDPKKLKIGTILKIPPQ